MKQSLLFTLPIIAVLALNSHAFVPLPYAEWVESDLKHLQGNWKVVRAEQNGKEWSSPFHRRELVIIGKRAMFPFRKNPQDIAWGGTLTIVPWKKHLDLICEDEQDNWKGIYQIDGDTLRWYISVKAQKRPKQFVTTKDNDDFLLIYERVK